MRRLLNAWIAAALLAWPGAALAEDVAIIIANEFYESYPVLRGAGNMRGLQRDFEDAGFTVEILSNTRKTASKAQAEALWRRVDGADRLVILIAGHVVDGAGQNWLLHVDAQPMNGFLVGREGLPLEPLIAMAGQRPGSALVAIAQPPQPAVRELGVSSGYVERFVPNGLTVVAGAPGQLVQVLRRDLLQPGRSIAAAAEAAAGSVRFYGYVPRDKGFVEGAALSPDYRRWQEEEAWRQATQRNTLEAYREYLRQYPGGTYAADARRREAELSLTPKQRAEQAEAALGLTRQQRAGIQRQLTLLGYDTRGVDGVLGRNSRAAIAAFQRDTGAPDTGFLTANQITQIEVRASARAAELRRQAEERRRAEERRDRRYWNQTGAAGSEQGLRAYLQRHPDGLFADQARAQLDAIERERRRQARAAEREAWNRAEMENSAQGYRRYLNAYPNGLFAGEAQARFQALSRPETPPDLVDAAQQEEQRLNLNAVTRNLIEGQLRKLGLEPGRADGQFTRETRRALRRFQRSSGLTVTGFVTRETMVRLLASAL